MIKSENIVLASSQTHSFFDPPTLLSFIKQTEWLNRHHPGLWIPHPLLTDTTLHHSPLPSSATALNNNNNNCMDAIYLNNTLCLATAAGAARDLIAISLLNFNHHHHEANTPPPSSSSSFPRSFTQVTGPLSQLTFNYSPSISSPTINPTLAARSNHNLDFYKLSPTTNMTMMDPNHQAPPPTTSAASASSSLLPSSFTLQQQPIASLSDLPLTSDLAWNRRLTDRSVLVCSDGTLMEVVLQPQGGCRCTTTQLIPNNTNTSTRNTFSSRSRCIFYPHPRVVAVSSSSNVYRADLREGQGRGTQMRQLFSVSPSSSSSGGGGGGGGEEIQALAVPESLSPHHRDTHDDDSSSSIDEHVLGVATQRRVLLYDLRNPALPLVAWEHRLVYGDRSSAGASNNNSIDGDNGLGTNGGINHLCFVPCSDNVEESSSSGCLLVSGSSSSSNSGGGGGGGTIACKFKIKKKEKDAFSSSSSSDAAVWSASSSRSYYTQPTPESIEREEGEEELRYSWVPGKKKNGEYVADTVPPKVVLDTLGSQSLHSLHTSLRSLSLQQQQQQQQGDVGERGEAVVAAAATAAATGGGGVPMSVSSSSTLRSIVTAIPKDVDTFFSLLQQQQHSNKKKKKSNEKNSTTTGTIRILLDTGKKQDIVMNRDPSLSGYPPTRNNIGVAVVVSDWVTRKALSWNNNSTNNNNNDGGGGGGGGGEDEDEEMMMQPSTSTAAATATATTARRAQRRSSNSSSSMPPVIAARLMAYGDIATSEISGAIVGSKEEEGGGGRGEMGPSSNNDDDDDGWRVLCPQEEDVLMTTMIPSSGLQPTIEEEEIEGGGMGNNNNNNAAGGGVGVGEMLTKGIPSETELVLQRRRDRNSVEMPLHLLLFQSSHSSDNNSGVRVHLRELLETVVARGSPVMMTVDEIKRGLEVKMVEDEQTRLLGGGGGGGGLNRNILPMVAVPALKTADMHRQKNEMMANCSKPQTALKNALSASKCVVAGMVRSGLAVGTDSNGNNNINPTSLAGMMHLIRGEEREGEDREEEEDLEEEEFRMLLGDMCRDMGGEVNFDSQHGIITICGGYQKN